MAEKKWRGTVEDRLRVVEDAIPVEAGGTFSIGAQQGEYSNLTTDILDLNAADMPADFDAASFQATDPTKPALVVITIETTVSAVIGTDTQGNLGGYIYSAKPLSAHMGELVALPISLSAIHIGAEGEETPSVQATWTERHVFVLPVGGWAFLYYIEDSGNIALGNCSRFDWALG